jgi:predicted SAM-dependent methyltransferase
MGREGPDWSAVFEAREKIHRTYREVWDIPLLKKRSVLLRRLIRDGMAVLDVGAGKKGVEEELRKLGIRAAYKSMDVDRSGDHDFFSLEEITGEYDAIVMFEVIEHMGLEEGLGLLKTLKGHAKKGGILVVSTPNIFMPGRYMRDATHKTFYGYDELCGLLELAGFEVEEVFRSYNDAFHRYFLKVHLLGFLFRFLSIDYAYSIFAVGRKKDVPP